MDMDARQRPPSALLEPPPSPQAQARGVRGGWEAGGPGLKVLALYPFLPEAARYVREQAPPLEEILAHRAYGAARHLARRSVRATLAEGSVDEPPLSTEAERLSALYAYPLSRMLVSSVGDTYLIRRFALAQADLARRRLEREDVDFLVRMAQALGMDAFREGGFRLHFADFLAATKRLRGQEWKLINHPVREGYVLLGRDRFLRVLEGHLRNRFEEELPLEVNDPVLQAFQEDVRDLRRGLQERRTRLEDRELGEVRVTNFPPCMQKLLAAVLASENVSHPGRFALVAFLNNLGLGFDEIYNVFASVPDFRESVTRYQIEHITGRISGTEYTAPECSTMKSYGICPGPDRLCETITHPLQYYRKKEWMVRRRATGRPRGGESASPRGSSRRDAPRSREAPEGARR